MPRPNGRTSEAIASLLYEETLTVEEQAIVQGLIGNGNPYSDMRLREITAAEGYEKTALTFDADGLLTTAVLKWPDGTPGVLTTANKNLSFLTYDSFSVTYGGSPVKTITQPPVTRDSAGNETIKPALIIS